MSKFDRPKIRLVWPVTSSTPLYSFALDDVTPRRLVYIIEIIVTVRKYGYCRLGTTAVIGISKLAGHFLTERYISTYFDYYTRNRSISFRVLLLRTSSSKQVAFCHLIPAGLVGLGWLTTTTSTGVSPSPAPSPEAFTACTRSSGNAVVQIRKRDERRENWTLQQQ